MTRINMMILGLATLLIVIMATPSRAAIPGPNDPRYPDVIVQPKVICDKEGVFPHPRNCSWYYRCVDRMNVGFYWTYHFECEPGTVFSDELDQCVFPFATGPPCGTGGNPVSTPSTGPTTTTSTTITTTTTTTTSTTTTPKPSTAPPTTLETTVQTITSPSVTKNFSCSFQPENCALQRPCLPGEAERALCTGCYVNGLYVSAYFLCGEVDGKLFDRDNNVCVDDPSLDPNCPLFDTTTPLAPTTTTTTEPTTTTPPPTTTVPVTTTDSPTNINITKEFHVRCTHDNPRPSVDWIIEKFCNQYFLCSPEGRYEGTATLCDNYYECSYDPEVGWDLKLMSCPKDLLFNYDQDKCVEKPSAEEICDFGGR
ncbi:uncharacterized protein [Palaemon carinicauda]|uniref:uncharacterized protein n=1 Tax=Palaemon carinicauda TaxID=392227 RepID=UPI0035B5D1B5